MIGKTLGPYQILVKLGEGGMGEVYEASDARLGRRVAIKVLPAAFVADPERRTRFEQEARTTAALSHPNIAAVYDVGAQGVTHYIVQELVAGSSLREVLRSRPDRPLGEWLLFAVPNATYRGPDGRELFYRSSTTQGAAMLTRAAVVTTPAFAVASRQTLFSVAEMATATPHRNYDISPDGRTFAMVRYNPATRIMVIQNLPALVRRLGGAAPAAR